MPGKKKVVRLKNEEAVKLVSYLRSNKGQIEEQRMRRYEVLNMACVYLGKDISDFAFNRACKTVGVKFSRTRKEREVPVEPLPAEDIPREVAMLRSRVDELEKSLAFQKMWARKCFTNVNSRLKDGGI